MLVHQCSVHKAFSAGSAPEIELPIPAPASLCQPSRDVTKKGQAKMRRAWSGEESGGGKRKSCLLSSPGVSFRISFPELCACALLY